MDTGTGTKRKIEMKFITKSSRNKDEGTKFDVKTEGMRKS